MKEQLTARQPEDGHADRQLYSARMDWRRIHDPDTLGNLFRRVKRQIAGLMGHPWASCPLSVCPRKRQLWALGSIFGDCVAPLSANHVDAHAIGHEPVERDAGGLQGIGLMLGLGEEAANIIGGDHRLAFQTGMPG